LAVWLFGIFGLSVCFLENAAAKNLLAMLGIGWSILALAWGWVAYRCSANELCQYDTSDNGWLLVMCLSFLVALLFYDKKKDKIPTVGKFLIKAFARSMVVLWACALLFSVATFNEPLHLRIDRTDHAITPQEIQSEASDKSK
jgi:apolipoprotein N-acyltransferase